MQGLHLTADCYDCLCDTQLLQDVAILGDACLKAVADNGLTPVGQLFHSFASPTCPEAGVTATILLAESHMCIHTWPELKAATLDVYVCNFSSDHSDKARGLMNDLLRLFKAEMVEPHTLHRGLMLP